MSYRTLAYEVREGVALITLDREASRNAVDAVMAQELPLAWAAFEKDRDARVAIITGRGNRIFCAGADLINPPSVDHEGAAATLHSIRWTAMQNGVTKPVICAVNGGAVGGGLHFPADADIVLASSDAFFADPHVAVGFVAVLEPIALARRMPLGAVMRMALTGGLERLSAAQAQALGLVDEVVEPSQLLAKAFALADKIKVHSPSALARTKQAIWASKELGLSDALQQGWTLIMDQSGHPDFHEGPRAFAEKRKPKWTVDGSQ